MSPGPPRQHTDGAGRKAAVTIHWRGIDAWAGNERWFSNDCSPMASEFTIHQNIGPAAAIFGFLCQVDPR
jgi:hypothetical protein